MNRIIQTWPRKLFCISSLALQFSPLYSFCGEWFQEGPGCVKSAELGVIRSLQKDLFQKLLDKKTVLIPHGWLTWHFLVLLTKLWSFWKCDNHSSLSTSWYGSFYNGVWAGVSLLFGVLSRRLGIHFLCFNALAISSSWVGTRCAFKSLWFLTVFTYSVSDTLDLGKQFLLQTCQPATFCVWRTSSYPGPTLPE